MESSGPRLAAGGAPPLTLMVPCANTRCKYGRVALQKTNAEHQTKPRAELKEGHVHRALESAGGGCGGHGGVAQTASGRLLDGQGRESWRFTEDSRR